MKKPNIKNVRLILDSHSRMCASCESLGFSIASSTKDGYSTVYTITEKNYKISDNHKIGFVGIPHLGVPAESFYQSDLKSIIERKANPYAGFYEIVPVTKIEINDILDLPAVDKHTREQLFNVPSIVLGFDGEFVFVKPIIELFRPVKKGFFDFLKRNPFGKDVLKLETSMFANKFQKLNVCDVIPGYHYDDLESA